MDSRSFFYHCPELDHGGYPEACPFNTRRAGKTRATVAGMGLLDGEGRMEVAPVAIPREQLEWYHQAEYLDVLSRVHTANDLDETGMNMGLGTPDCPVFPGMYEYVRLAAGGTLCGAQAILSGQAQIAFNPSGGFHHAMPGAAAGFCYLNDVVIGCEALARGGMRVLFLDIDVHHSDGVQQAFYARNDVMVVSMHESGRTLFPGTGFENENGTGQGAGYTLNIPLPVGTGDELYRQTFTSAVWPVIKAYDPDVLVVELGMDALAGDPLAHLHLTNNTHADILERLLNLGKPILATGGGGYHIENTVRSWALCWSVLCGEHNSQYDAGIGLGGVMLESTEWLGGLRDRVLLSDAGRRADVKAELVEVVNRIKQSVFPVHGLTPSGAPVA